MVFNQDVFRLGLIVLSVCVAKYGLLLLKLLLELLLYGIKFCRLIILLLLRITEFTKFSKLMFVFVSYLLIADHNCFNLPFQRCMSTDKNFKTYFS